MLTTVLGGKKGTCTCNVSQEIRGKIVIAPGPKHCCHPVPKIAATLRHLFTASSPPKNHGTHTQHGALPEQFAAPNQPIHGISSTTNPRTQQFHIAPGGTITATKKFTAPSHLNTLSQKTFLEPLTFSIGPTLKRVIVGHILPLAVRPSHIDPCFFAPSSSRALVLSSFLLWSLLCDFAPFLLLIPLLCLGSCSASFSSPSRPSLLRSLHFVPSPFYS